jgi:hypothetical protein
MSPLVPYTRKGENFVSIPDPDQSSPHLLYAVRKKLCLHLDGEKKEYLIKDTHYTIKALVIHEGRLIEARVARILYAETNELLVERDLDVYALAVYNGDLIDAGQGGQILRTETDEPIVEGRAWVDVLTIYNGRLVDSETRPKGRDFISRISYTETGELIAERPFEVNALAVHKNRLVHAEEAPIQELHAGRILDTETGELIAERPDSIQALAIYKGRLIDAGYYNGIYYTEEKRHIVETTDGFVSALLPIGDKMANRLLKGPEVSELK